LGQSGEEGIRVSSTEFKVARNVEGVLDLGVEAQEAE
jgi:hypothetical protein